PYSVCIFTSSGTSLRHGPHQVAHRSINNTLPFKSDNLNAVPSIALSDASSALAGNITPAFGAPPGAPFAGAVEPLTVILIFVSFAFDVWFELLQLETPKVRRSAQTA